MVAHPKLPEITSKELQVKAINQDTFYKEIFLPFSSLHELLTVLAAREMLMHLGKRWSCS